MYVCVPQMRPHYLTNIYSNIQMSWTIAIDYNVLTNCIQRTGQGVAAMLENKRNLSRFCDANERGWVGDALIDKQSCVRACMKL